MKVNASVIPKLFMKEPRLAGAVAKTFFKMGVVRHTPKGDAGVNHFKHLSLVYFKLTPLCNLHCVMCGQYGVHGKMRGGRAAGEAKTIVPLSRYEAVVDELAGTVPVMYLWGGEPFLYPDLMPLAKYIVDRGIFMAVNTNGTFLEARAEEIVRDKWSTVLVSLDALRDVNDSIRGTGSYDKVVRGIAAINAEKRRRKAVRPFLGIVTTVTRLNYASLEAFVLATRDFHLDFHLFNLGTYTNDAIVAQQRDFMKTRLDTDIDCLEGYNTGYNEGIDAETLYATLQRIHSPRFGDPPLGSTRITIPALNPEKIHTYYADLETPVRNHCIVPWSHANVNYNGDVHFCADYPDYILGNIKTQSFREVYNGDRANRFRRAIHTSEGGMAPGCLRCYQNMLCGKRIKGF